MPRNFNIDGLFNAAEHVFAGQAAEEHQIFEEDVNRENEFFAEDMGRIDRADEFIGEIDRPEPVEENDPEIQRFMEEVGILQNPMADMEPAAERAAEPEPEPERQEEAIDKNLDSGKKANNKVGKVLSKVLESKKVSINYINNYIDRKLNYNERDSYQAFLSKAGFRFYKLSNCIILTNCAIAKFGKESAEWGNLCKLYRKMLRIIEYLSMQNSPAVDQLPILCRTITEARAWIPRFSKTIYDLIEEYSTPFGIIQLNDDTKFLDKDILYPGEHAYYIANIDEYWGRYISSQIQLSNGLFEVIQETCPNFIHLLTGPVFILEDSEAKALKDKSTEFFNITEFREKYKNLKLTY